MKIMLLSPSTTSTISSIESAWVSVASKFCFNSRWRPHLDGPSITASAIFRKWSDLTARIASSLAGIITHPISSDRCLCQPSQLLKFTRFLAYNNDLLFMRVSDVHYIWDAGAPSLKYHPRIFKTEARCLFRAASSWEELRRFLLLPYVWFLSNEQHVLDSCRGKSSTQ